MNILLTEHCNKNCDFCLIPNRQETPGNMSAHSFEMCLDFAEASGQRFLTLLGGEPTENPKFIQLVERAKERGFRIVLLSNFLFNQKKARAIHGWAREGVIQEFLVNADFPTEYTAGQLLRLRTNLRNAPASSIRVTLAVTLRDIRPLDEYAYLKSYYDELDISRIRVSMDVRALASAVGQPKIGEHYYRVVRYLVEHGFAVGAELCAVARCIFTDYQHEYLRCHCTGYERDVSCEPNLDIFPDLRVAYCASRPSTPVFWHPLSEFATVEHMRAYFRGLRDTLNSRTETVSNATPDACATCVQELKNECKLGCLAPFDELTTETNALVLPSLGAPSNVRITPLLDRWHVWTGACSVDGDSVVVDNIGMQILSGAWAGIGTDEIAGKMSGQYDISPTRARADVVAVLGEAKARGVLM